MNWPSMRTISEPTRWDPFEEIYKTQERLNMLFKDFMPMEIWEEENVFSPAVDIRDEGENILVTTDLPGINKDDIELNLKEGMLEISAKSGKEVKTEDEGCIRKEREYTHFYRGILLPTNVKEEGSTAKMENGVLTINLPKIEQETPTKKIQIK